MYFLTVSSSSLLSVPFIQASNVSYSFSFFRWAFKMYDKDGNGSVDLEEMVEIIGTLYDMEGASKVSSTTPLFKTLTT